MNFKIKIAISVVLILVLIALLILSGNNIGAVIKDFQSNLSGGFFIAIYSVADILSNIEHPQKRIFSINIKGRIVDATNGRPIGNAAIAIEYGVGGFDTLKFDKIETTSTSDGVFKISIDKGGYFSIKVGANGYYPYWSRVKTLFRNKIELYPVTAPQNISIDIGRIGIKDNKVFGYNFQKKETTFNMNEADIILKPGIPGIKMYKVTALGEGGVIKAKEMSNNHYNFYNTPLAPVAGYKKEAILSMLGGVDFYYFRTADGKHYGKMYIGTPGESTNTIDCGFHYVFQSEENNRNLEITYTK